GGGGRIGGAQAPRPRIAAPRKTGRPPAALTGPAVTRRRSDGNQRLRETPGASIKERHFHASGRDPDAPAHAEPADRGKQMLHEVDLDPSIARSDRHPTIGSRHDEICRCGFPAVLRPDDGRQRGGTMPVAWRGRLLRPGQLYRSEAPSMKRGAVKHDGAGGLKQRQEEELTSGADRWRT